MTVTVYVWLPEAPQVGHASMELEDGTYVSLWPGEGKANSKKKTKKDKKQDIHTSENLDEDIDEEGRNPNHTFYIDGLNENKIRRWWNGFNKTSWSWTQNCCKTVIDGLREGGSDSKLSGCKYFVGMIWTPGGVVNYCQDITK